MITYKAEIDDVLNNNFSIVFTQESEDPIPVPPISYQGVYPLEDTKCSAAKTAARITTLKTNNSAGSDGLRS